MMSAARTTVAVTGAAGMLGQEVAHAAPSWAQAVGLTRADGDLSVTEQCRRALLRVKPAIIVHCAAYTDVDGATECPAKTHRGNVVATRNVANAADEVGALLLYVSSDYVFDGTAQEPYTESATPAPINPYGESKLRGEYAARTVREHLVVRTQWLFGPGGRNFLQAILEAAADGRDLRVVDDERGCPTYTVDLARGLWRLLEVEARGIVHLTNRGACTRLELARAALEDAGLLEAVALEGIPAGEWDSPTRRPLNAVLTSERLGELGVESLRPWREAVRDYVAVLGSRRQ